MLRQQVRPDARIHGIITNGGAAANIIPEFAAALFYVRAPRLDEMWALYQRVIACAEGAARATGATLKIVERDDAYHPMKRVPALLDVYRANLRALGPVESPAPGDRLGSSDVGNLSQVLPTIQPLVKIAPDGTRIHSRAFAAAAASPLAREGMLTAAKAMAMTALDLLSDPELLPKIRREFEAAG
jgi:metal-dependent amidase/aminoacylase/carboxypeptidase family protein